MTVVQVEYEHRERPKGKPSMEDELAGIARGFDEAAVVEFPALGQMTVEFARDTDARSFGGRLAMQAAVVRSVTFPDLPTTSA